MQEYSFLSRRYRNRRIGEFLKELGMTEGRGTGIPKIMKVLQKNGSPQPIFHTDKERTFLVVELPLHHSFKQETLQEADTMSSHITKIIQVCNEKMSRKDLMTALNLKDRVNFMNNYLNPAIEQGLIKMTIPDNPNNRELPDDSG